MTVKLTGSGAIETVNESWGLRLIEQGRAIPIGNAQSVAPDKAGSAPSERPAKGKARKGAK